LSTRGNGTTHCLKVVWVAKLGETSQIDDEPDSIDVILYLA